MWLKRNISQRTNVITHINIENIPLSYASDESNFIVVFTKDVFLKIFRKCNNSNRIETGGILLGKYSADSSIAHILNYSGPPPDSRQSSGTFFRGIMGLSTSLDRLWESGQYYLGEWHYHPHALSTPSQQDICQMQQIAEDIKYKCPEPVLLVVGGSEQKDWGINVSVFQRGLKGRITLLPKVTN